MPCARRLCPPPVPAHHALGLSLCLCLLSADHACRPCPRADPLPGRPCPRPLPSFCSKARTCFRRPAKPVPCPVVHAPACAPRFCHPGFCAPGLCPLRFLHPCLARPRVQGVLTARRRRARPPCVTLKTTCFDGLCSLSRRWHARPGATKRQRPRRSWRALRSAMPASHPCCPGPGAVARLASTARMTRKCSLAPLDRGGTPWRCQTHARGCAPLQRTSPAHRSRRAWVSPGTPGPAALTRSPSLHTREGTPRPAAQSVPQGCARGPGCL